MNRGRGPHGWRPDAAGGIQLGYDPDYRRGFRSRVDPSSHRRSSLPCPVASGPHPRIGEPKPNHPPPDGFGSRACPNPHAHRTTPQGLPFQPVDRRSTDDPDWRSLGRRPAQTAGHSPLLTDAVRRGIDSESTRTQHGKRAMVWANAPVTRLNTAGPPRGASDASHNPAPQIPQGRTRGLAYGILRTPLRQVHRTPH
jgi:hypothetical protein